jgi:hypothetical protein
MAWSSFGAQGQLYLYLLPLLVAYKYFVITKSPTVKQNRVRDLGSCMKLDVGTVQVQFFDTSEIYL